SGAGIAEGARTGLAAVMTGFLFFIALFFAPIFASFPPWATGPALIAVGSMMMQNITQINWHYLGDALPAFVTIIMIPFSYSIGYGLIAGISTFVAINSFAFILHKISRGRIVPPNYDLRDDWAGFVSRGGYRSNVPGWMQRLASRVKRSPPAASGVDSAAELKEISIEPAQR
ncbi:hypothetical protein H4R19_006707, partial [Coemansia spiralis]